MYEPWFRDQYGHVYSTAPARPLQDFPDGFLVEHPLVCTPRHSASLIAAAPDLLDALQRVMRHIPANAGGASLSDDMYRASKAIQKATNDFPCEN